MNSAACACAPAEASPGNSAGSGAATRGERQHQRLHAFEVVEQALDPVERDAEEHHHRQRLREAEAQLRARRCPGRAASRAARAAPESPRAPSLQAAPAHPARAPARVPEVPGQPDVHGRGDAVNYNVGHRFSLSPMPRHPAGYPDFAPRAGSSRRFAAKRASPKRTSRRRCAKCASRCSRPTSRCRW